MSIVEKEVENEREYSLGSGNTCYADDDSEFTGFFFVSVCA